MPASLQNYTRLGEAATAIRAAVAEMSGAKQPATA
jgi:hypothetical protein